jgi:isoquinoline 1-oxidoreductase beta subunit
MKRSNKDPRPARGPDGGDAHGLRRRDVLGYATAAPLASAAAGIAGLGALTAPASAVAALLPMTPPDTTDLIDIGDAVTLTSLPTMPLVKVTNTGDGRVRLALPRLEVGQGIATASAMMLADKLRLPLSAIEVTSADASPELIWNQLTGGSSSVRSMHAGMPTLGGLGGLLSGSTPSVVGQRVTRLDALDIVTGRKKFTLDQAVPGAKPTMVRRPPTINGKFVGINNLNTVMGMPGVIGVVPIPATNGITPTPPGVAVMAETFGQAWAAVNALDVTWGAGPLDGESNATIMSKLKSSLLPFALPPLGALTVEAEFEFAPAAHCPMEVECAIADVRADRAEIWAGLQSPIVTQQAVAAELGLPLNKVVVHVVPSGGSFGPACSGTRCCRRSRWRRRWGAPAA